jgi:SAM-dependent methyltransferase
MDNMNQIDRSGPPPTLRSLWWRCREAYERDGFAMFAANAFRMISDRCLNKGVRKLQSHFDAKLDRRYGLDTQGIYFAADMPFSSPHKEFACNYQPTSEYTFRHLMAYLPNDLAGFDFIDIGCGKGRVLFYAAAWQFNRIVGVELAPPLAAFAKRNVDLYAAKTGDRRLEAYCQDAIEMAIPEGPCVFFFASPFIDPVFGKMLAKIEASYRARPRKIFVIYYDSKPVLDLVTRFHFLKLISRGAIWHDPIAIWIYPYAVFESPE